MFFLETLNKLTSRVAGGVCHLEISHRQPEQGFVHLVRKAGFPGLGSTTRTDFRVFDKGCLSRKIPLGRTRKAVLGCSAVPPVSLSENHS